MKEIDEIQKEKLVKKHTALVIKIAYEILEAYNLRKDFLPDLKQEGHMGLLESINNFDSSKGAKLITYAFPRILGSMIKGLRKNNFIHIPDKKLRKIREIIVWKDILSAHLLEREHFLKDISQYTGYPIQEIKKLEDISDFCQQPVSLNNSTEEGQELIKCVSERNNSPEIAVIEKENKEKIYEILDTLPLLDAEIIKMRFGLKGGKEYSIRELSKIFSISRHKVEKIELDTAYKLSNQKESVQMRTLPNNSF